MSCGRAEFHHGLLALLVAAVVASSSPAQELPAPIAAWLECTEECDQQLLDAVRRGDFAPEEEKRTTLERILREGPPRARLEENRAALARNWERFYGDPEIPTLEGVEPLSQDEYVALFSANLVHRYRVRAGEALSLLGDRESLAVFREVLGDQELIPRLREDTAVVLRGQRVALERRLQ